MAITQKNKVVFTVTSVLRSEDEKTIAEDLVKLAKAFCAGETHYKGYPIDHKQRHLLELFVTEGMEGVTRFLVRHAMREAIKEMREEYSDSEDFKFSPAVVTKVL